MNRHLFGVPFLRLHIVMGLVLTALTLTGAPLSRAENALAPSFSVEDLRGDRQSPEQYRGQPAVIYFWATWCPNCRSEVAAMDALYRNYARENVHFISVSLDENLGKLKRFVDQKNIPYPVVFGGAGWGTPLSRLYGVQGIPTYFLLNRDGEIVDAGNRTEDLEASLRKMLARA